MSAYLGDKLVSLTAHIDYNTNDATAGVEDVLQGEVFYNAEGRQVGIHVCPTVDELLPELSNPATADKILSGYEAVDGTGNKLTGTSNAKVLPSLSNPAGADQILAGYEAVNGLGELLTGIFVDNSITSVEVTNCQKALSLSKLPKLILASLWDGGSQQMWVFDIVNEIVYETGYKTNVVVTDNKGNDKIVGTRLSSCYFTKSTLTLTTLYGYNNYIVFY